MEKIRFIAACLLSLITAGGVAYGILHDNPQRFQKGLVGQIVSVESRGSTHSVTIQLEEFDTLLNLDVSPDVKVWRAFESSDLQHVKPGQFASLRLGSDHRTVNEIHVTGVQHEVAIREFNDSGVMMAAVMDDDDDSVDESHRFQLAPDAILRIGGLPARRTDFKEGMEVPLELAQDGYTVHAIEAEADPETIVVGSLVSVDETSRLIVIATEDENDSAVRLNFTLDRDALVEVDGRRAELSSIRVGSEIIVRTSPDRQSVGALRATSPEPDDDSESSTP